MNGKINTKKTFLRTTLVKKIIKEKGRTITWVKTKTGLGHTAASNLMSVGVLPANEARAIKALKAISRIVKLPIEDITTTIKG